MSPAWRLRPFADGDRKGLIALWRDCGLLRPWNDPAEDIGRCLASPGSRLWVAERDGRLIGSVMCGSDGHRGWLYYLAVASDQRRRGLGRALVAAAEAWLAGRGIGKSMLMLRPDNAATVEFYTTLGYSQEPRLVMARWLDAGAAPPAGADGNPP